MNSWRITKYNPDYRTVDGVYNRDEWTSFDDIGDSVDKELYLKIEDKYIEQLKYISKELGISLFKVKQLEKHDEKLELDSNKELYSKEFYDVYDEVEEDLVVNMDDALIIARLNLRNNLWCKLMSFNDEFEVHFGYDFYMYVLLLPEFQKHDFMENGLYVEEFDSPYI